MKISLSKSDIIWSYIAQFFNVGAGLITLPFILHILSTDEIALNYLMITISTIVSLIDFGFAPQFSRNISYIYSGAQEIKKEGVGEISETINIQLLANMIGVAKMVYKRMAFIALLIMLTGGTYYIYRVTNGFELVNNAFIIWMIFSVSVYFNIYYLYYESLLMGKGLIKEAKKAMLAQRLTGIIITFGMLFAGYGLLSVVLANFISPFVGRIMSKRFFFDSVTSKGLANYRTNKHEQLKLFKTLWHNSKKFGLVMLGSYAINKLGMFFAGLYLSFSDVASYGLMIQLMTIISTLSMTFQSSLWPQMASFRATNDRVNLIKKFALSLNIFYILFFVGFIMLIFIAPPLLKLLNSNATLPNTLILSLYSLIILLENNHSAFASLILVDNKVPFMESALISGFLICLMSWLVLYFTNTGILGLILVQGIIQLLYSNWKWPYVVCKDFNLSFLNIMKLGLSETRTMVLSYARR